MYMCIYDIYIYMHLFWCILWIPSNQLDSFSHFFHLGFPLSAGLRAAFGLWDFRLSGYQALVAVPQARGSGGWMSWMSLDEFGCWDLLVYVGLISLEFSRLVVWQFRCPLKAVHYESFRQIPIQTPWNVKKAYQTEPRWKAQPMVSSYFGFVLEFYCSLSWSFLSVLSAGNPSWLSSIRIGSEASICLPGPVQNFNVLHMKYDSQNCAAGNMHKHELQHNEIWWSWNLSELRGIRVFSMNSSLWVACGRLSALGTCEPICQTCTFEYSEDLGVARGFWRFCHGSSSDFCDQTILKQNGGKNNETSD